ncbi:MAG TPA: acyl-[acyl-carrier-protein]--UDP-N-acetylglucosamine O-acyltransferase [Elusimicrobia bacterium]|nr:MAG: acyl-[acyl-carrier-protein]--UDP-N-acetylglucosamine O-acyltransferase [Elusimicrobia bacterium RIFOXYA12_FULL_49_49]OGS15914.1 MAG: acyl-[acyl-carrier-protein]--UDP-N-acetylglucosamine O-acyltransferase [Elusimicrobia bacterium RIFOXYA2_FULL_47_53]OGS26404.1 MAG: acyl-[acyl-carrier-protein]--UDP-N-acetylglucosamine O-acyltransferase [Elusimicrobia bacterium RIFOXYB12_FULL_50_12]OGS29082.1 MAG: acyl-[acyl-carrier-protein]--UDP-N-acetylglucosamine O-acyltransferase [Elusimicrobia bacteriu
MIHQTAIIHKSAVIDPSADIGPYAVIGENTIIGQGTKVGPHAVLEFCEIGKNCRISSHAALGTPPQDLKYNNEPTKLIVGDNCSIREYVTLNRGTAAHGRTEIGSGCLFMAYTHVAHDCIIGNNVIMANAATLGGHVEVADNAVLSSLVAVHQFTKIGSLAMIGGGSMVAQDILPFVQVQGDRAKLVGLNLVGLRRKGFKPGEIEEIKSAYRTLFLSALTMEEALDQLEASNPGREVRQMIDFIHASKRGICRPGRKENTEEI